MLFALAPLLLAVAAGAQPLVTPSPTREARSLKALLDHVYGKAMLSGQCDDKYLPFIKEHSGGKEPTIMGYDFNGICPSQDGNRDVEKATAWHERGGIVTFQWHWISPDANGDFYTDNYDLAAARADPSSDSFKNLLRDIDLCAAELLRLQEAGVPVLWRPLHEAEGGWFWWGKSGREACIELYRLMFERFTKHHGLRNLVWVWTSYAGEKENWYPGDDVVDLIVRDYEAPGTWAAFQAEFGNNGKLFGLGEEGKLPDPANFEARPWLYFLTWAYMIEDPDKGNTPAWIRSVYNDPKVITLDELPQWRKAAGT